MTNPDYKPHAMACPICTRTLKRWFRVVKRIRPRLQREKLVHATVYVPIWVCTKCQHSVEINTLSKHVVQERPARQRLKHRPGSAAL